MKNKNLVEILVEVWYFLNESNVKTKTARRND